MTTAAMAAAPRITLTISVAALSTPLAAAATYAQMPIGR